jgi:hypothetical protein
MDIPVCANHAEGRCERSSTFVESEKQGCYVIRCRTCGAVNIWPSNATDKKGQFDAFLQKKIKEHQEQLARERKRAYSFGGN